jgi:two-component system, NarL family, sensor kinase
MSDMQAAARPRTCQGQATATDQSAPIAGDDGAEALLRSALDALSAHVAVLDETGAIIAVNEAWRSFAAASGYVGADDGVGANYLQVCEASAAASEDAARTAQALRQIISGTRSSFRMEYPCTGPDGLRWFQLRVTSSKAAPVRRVVIAHEDITDVKRAEASLARLNARILQLQDEERRRIARELHDTTAQNLLAISLNAARLHDPLRGGGEQAPKIAAEILALAEQSLQEVRTLSYLLHPPLLDEIGLEAALRWLAKGLGDRSGIEIEVHCDDLGGALSQEIATALFRVAQEALLNVRRHSESDWARLSLRLRGDLVELEVEDRGRGLGTPAGTGEAGDEQFVGVGISGMRLRLEQLGGRLELRSQPCGLLVRALVPIERARPADESA